jgi:hypothetical protein
MDPNVKCKLHPKADPWLWGGSWANPSGRLNAYYIFIHQYFPVFPPPHVPQAVDQPLDFICDTFDPMTAEPSLVYQPRSAVSLAISAILALVPHPKDPNPADVKSVLLRRTYAHQFARLSLEAVEADSELVESNADPSEALQTERPVPHRLPIHPCAPVELESILALLILSIYEYTQRGNLTKMRIRANQAYIMAMNMALHTLGPEMDAFTEARRRAWWMTVRDTSGTHENMLMTTYTLTMDYLVLLHLPGIYR